MDLGWAKVPTKQKLKRLVPANQRLELNNTRLTFGRIEEVRKNVFPPRSESGEDFRRFTLV